MQTLLKDRPLIRIEKAMDQKASSSYRRLSLAMILGLLIAFCLSLWVPVPQYSFVYSDFAAAYEKDPATWDKAIDLYKRAIYHNPKNPDPYYKIGFLYQQKKDYAKTIEYYKKFIAFDQFSTSQTRAFIAVGYDYMLNKDYLQAVRVFRKAMWKSPEDVEVYYAMALAYHRLKYPAGIFEQIKTLRRWVPKQRKRKMLERSKEYSQKFFKEFNMDVKL